MLSLKIFILSLGLLTSLASKSDFRSYVAKSDNAKVKSSSQKDKPKASYLIQSASNITGETEIQLVQEEVKKQTAKRQYERIPLKIKQGIGSYASTHETKAAIDCFSKVYTKLFLNRTIVNAWYEKKN